MAKAADCESEDCGFDSHHGLYTDLSIINSYHGLYTLNIVYPMKEKSAYFNKRSKIEAQYFKKDEDDCKVQGQGQGQGWNYIE